ncbi:sugar phosphate isomerase/epimerase family protein [Propionicimonas sp. T2.31MG-18]|uniref:sugar phosphate isomerase/epimerase family protein n=1 Tax=Propionicimonas sp. T2.31MG-18 TaxID=3157620 RepID=UPI00366CCE77
MFGSEGVRFAHEVHPSEIAYDYWLTVLALEAINHREAFGLNWDPSHMMWQQIDPVGFLVDFADRVYHVDCKDTKMATAATAGWAPTCLATVGTRPPRRAPHRHRPAPQPRWHHRRRRQRPHTGEHFGRFLKVRLMLEWRILNRRRAILRVRYDEGSRSRTAVDPGQGEECLGEAHVHHGLVNHP